MNKHSKSTHLPKMAVTKRDSKRDRKDQTVARKQQRSLKQARRTGKLEIR